MGEPVLFDGYPAEPKTNQPLSQYDDRILKMLLGEYREFYFDLVKEREPDSAQTMTESYLKYHHSETASPGIKRETVPPEEIERVGELFAAAHGLKPKHLRYSA